MQSVSQQIGKTILRRLQQKTMYQSVFMHASQVPISLFHYKNHLYCIPIKGLIIKLLQVLFYYQLSLNTYFKQRGHLVYITVQYIFLPHFKTCQSLECHTIVLFALCLYIQNNKSYIKIYTVQVLVFSFFTSLIGKMKTLRIFHIINWKDESITHFSHH